MTEFRKMTMGEIAEISDDPKETIRARINRGVHKQQKRPGWARFDVPSTMQIAVHAEMMRRTGIDEIAIQTGNFVAESIANYCNYPPYTIKRTGQLDGAYLIFRRRDSLLGWTYIYRQSQEEAAKLAGEYIFETHNSNLAGFYFLNVSSVTDWAMDRIFDLQGIEGNIAEAPR